MKKTILFLLGIIAAVSGMRADEGMWTLYNLDQRTFDKMRELGFEMTQEELYNELGTSLKDAVVLFGGFCSGVVVSPNGLVFTNHHCGYAAINQLSTTDDDILRNGFAARSLADERPVEGLWVAFLDKVIDLTAQADAGVDCDSIGSAYESLHPGCMTSVDRFFGGTVTLMQVYKQYNDIRLAFAPTESLGKFGGDTDNWMWPRHTSDFSVFRVYTAPNGEPAGYNCANIPLRAKRWAKVSLDGFALNDYCMTVGFPGSTSRYMSSFGIENRMLCDNAAMISVRGVKQDAWKRWMNSDREIALKYSTKYAQSSNYWKNSIGMNRALKKLGVVKRKQKLEGEIKRWIKADPARQAKYGNMLDELKNDYKSIREEYRALYFTAETFRGSEIFRLARSLQSILLSDSADAQAVADHVFEGYKKYDARVDRDALVAMVRNYMREVPKKYHPKFLAEIKTKWKGSVEDWVDDLFNQSVADEERAPYMAIDPVNDEQIANDVAAKLDSEIRLHTLNTLANIADQMKRTERNEDLLTQAILEMQEDQPHYSDANMTMRLSYGTIKDYTGTDGVHQDAQTWPAQLLAKAEQQNEIADYRMEAEIAEMFRKADWGRYADKKQGDLPLCFLSTNDITGGNSGSPMFNGKGELIGLAFDGNWDAMSGDITFEPSLQRCIGVDIRWILFLMDKWAGAQGLVNEVLGIRVNP